MFITLLFFIVGSTVGAYHLPFWTEEMPSFKPFSLATSTGLGYTGAWIISLIFFGLVAWVTLRVEKVKNPPAWQHCLVRKDGSGLCAVLGRLWLPLSSSLYSMR
ncbi:hypothetical protein ACPJHQ_09560 [Rossellomorea sp. H39__3]